MATETTDRTELCPILDPRLFTFKPKLNQKSNEIAQNLLTDFYERQLKHVKRLQELKEVAASNYRDWYCSGKRSKNEKEKDKPLAEETATNSDNELPLEPVKDVQTKNERLARLIRIYRSPLPRRAGIPPGLIQTPSVRRPVPHPISAPAPLTQPPPMPSPPPPPPPPAQIPHVPIPFRPSRRMSPIARPKSPPKIIRRAESPPKVTRRAESPSKSNVRRVESPPRRPIINESINIERLKLARDEAERAMKEHKIFTIYGPYPALREALRRRGWIEKFDRGSLFPSLYGNKKSDKRNNKSDDDDDDDTNDDELGDDDLEEGTNFEDENYVPPWEENDGYYGLLSRLVKTAPPDFIWSVYASYDTSTLTKDQMVNHYSRNGCFTTKVGLCSSLKNLPWFYSGSADEFYPRCYKLTHDDDKIAFIDDYRLTSCISFLKLAYNRSRGILEPDMNSILAMSSDNRTDPALNPDDEPQLTRGNTILGKIPSTKKVPASNIEFALNKVEQFTLSRDHEDIDVTPNSQDETTDEQWTQFIEQFYAAAHSHAEIENMNMYLPKIEQCLKNIEQHWPQYHIDGTRNIWILKPGAKSRGRGIVVYDRLDDILKLCSSTLTNDRKFVVQKYIERPLLIHNTKFDIRQWFLVTDWNPLTIWMFKDCYLRFCTEHFSLATRQQNVHLCNYSIQKHYKNNSNRHPDLPEENMWRNSEFTSKYLLPNNLVDKWDSLIYPAMKDAIICSMLVAQDTIEPRRSSFELFGADFMLGEDLKPWLIEINCSPTMARCTAVTTEMCDGVLEDTCKIIIDRKYNRSNDTGRFELIHKGAPVPVPIYVGMELRVEGKTCKTGRTHHNTTKIVAPVSAPPQISPTKEHIVDSELEHPHSTSALDNSRVIDPNETISSESTLDKLDDCPYHFHPTNKVNQFSIIRQKKSAKPKSTRVTIDTSPVRSRHNSRTQSSKGKTSHGVSKINVDEFLFKDQETNQSTNASLFRRFKTSWLSYNNTGKSTPKISQRSTTTLMPIDNESEHITVIKVA